MDKWNKARWILALLFAGLATQAALIYAVLFFRQAMHGTPAFWNGGYAILWGLWAARLWVAASSIRRQDDTEEHNAFKGSVLFMNMSVFGTTFSFLIPPQLPNGNPSAASFVLVSTCLTMTLALACAWYEKRRQRRAASLRRDAS